MGIGKTQLRATTARPHHMMSSSGELAASRQVRSAQTAPASREGPGGLRAPLPRQSSTEYVRPYSFFGSWRALYQGLRYKSHPIMNQLVSVSQATIAAFAGGYVLSSMSPALSDLGYVVSALASVETMPLYYLSQLSRNQVEKDGVFIFDKSIAGHAYHVNASGIQADIEPLDPILDIHLNPDELQKVLRQNRKQKNPSKVFEDLLERELGRLIGEMKERFSKDPELKAVRMLSPIHPRFFTDIEEFEIKDLKLSRRQTDNGAIKASYAKLLKHISLGLDQVFVTRFMRAVIQMNPLKFFTKSHSTRTYIIPREAIENWPE
jgi:hypothetical protein